MANYEACARSSYFKLEEGAEERFQEICKRYQLEPITSENPEHGTLHGFLCEENYPTSYYDEEAEEDREEDPLGEIGPLLAPGWAVVVMEVGHQKLAFLNAWITTVNREGECRMMNLEQQFEPLVREIATHFTEVAY